MTIPKRTECWTMRELVDREVEQVGGGVLNLASGAAGAAFGGFGAGAIYAVKSVAEGDGFDWGDFGEAVAFGAGSGFLMGTGASLVVAAATGVLPGAATAGITIAGATAAFGAAYWVNPNPMPH